MFVRFGMAPLGYDTGFYLESIKETFSSLGYSKSAVRAYLWVPFVWLRVPNVYILHGLYILFQFLTVGSVYILARSFHASSRIVYGVVAVFLYAVSIPQFLAFWWMFYQMELAVALLLITIALMHRRSVLAVMTGAFGAAIHPPTFLPFGIALVLFLILQSVRSLFQRKKLEKETIFILGLGLAAFILVKRFGGDFIAWYLGGSVTEYGWFLTNFPEHLKQMYTGLYINFEIFRLANIYLLPFSGIGVLLFLFGKLRSKEPTFVSRLLLALVLLVVLFIASYFPFIYHNRFLIILDLMLIIFAVYPFSIFILRLLKNTEGQVMLFLLLLGFVLFNGFMVWNQKPQVYPDELAEIRAIDVVASPSDYAMATESVYTPWVKAFSNRATIDPGFFPTNQWDYEMWKEFWKGESNDRRHELLQMYDRPIYIFVGKIVSNDIPYRRFIVSDPHFSQISPHVWRYDPNLARTQ
ncbi:MAG: hypothetical protein Q7S16_00135 [bacterium]|nr:hypothetical protein [bacterium]